MMTLIDCHRRAALEIVTLGALSAGFVTGCAPSPSGAEGRRIAAERQVEQGRVSTALAALETRYGGRLGVTIMHTGAGQSVSHRGGERFGMASSFKFALAALVLREGDLGRLSLDAPIPISANDLVSHSPVVKEELPKGFMSVTDLARAAQTTSDNAAANILLRLIGGPAGFTQRLRALGDGVTRLDRIEPYMNAVDPSDPRDTTTPMAMAQTMAKLLTTDYLSARSRKTLLNWMIATQTGQKRIRAGLPAGWIAGDKTGTAMPDEESLPDRYNDIAIAWPSAKMKGKPLFITAYYESPVKSANMRAIDEAVLAQVGTIAAGFVAL